MKFGSISEEEQPVMPKNKKHTTSKKPITPKKTKADVKLDQAELQKLSSEEDFEVDEDLYKDPVLQFNDGLIETLKSLQATIYYIFIFKF